MSMTPAVRTWHRRLSLLVGLQLLAWTVSGLVFTWDPIEVVRGETLLREPTPQTLPATFVPAEVARRASSLQSPTSMRLTVRRNRWVWELHDLDDGRALVDAQDGRLLQAVSPDEAQQLVAARLVTPAPVSTVTLVEEATGEYRGKPLPAWRVVLGASDNPAIYVDTTTGEIHSVRTDTWRRFDFFWSLHIMDYTERTDFSTWWLKAVAMLGVATSLSGLTLGVLVLTARRRARAARA